MRSKVIVHVPRTGTYIILSALIWKEGMCSTQVQDLIEVVFDERGEKDGDADADTELGQVTGLTGR